MPTVSFVGTLADNHVFKLLVSAKFGLLRALTARLGSKESRKARELSGDCVIKQTIVINHELHEFNLFDNQQEIIRVIRAIRG